MNYIFPLINNICFWKTNKQMPEISLSWRSNPVNVACKHRCKALVAVADVYFQLGPVGKRIKNFFINIFSKPCIVYEYFLGRIRAYYVRIFIITYIEVQAKTLKFSSEF